MAPNGGTASAPRPSDSVYQMPTQSVLHEEGMMANYIGASYLGSSGGEFERRCMAGLRRWCCSGEQFAVSRAASTTGTSFHGPQVMFFECSARLKWWRTEDDLRHFALSSLNVNARQRGLCMATWAMRRDRQADGVTQIFMHRWRSVCASEVHASERFWREVRYGGRRPTGPRWVPRVGDPGDKSDCPNAHA